MGRKPSWNDAAQHVARVGKFYHNVSCITASHVRGDELESKGER